MTRTYEQFKWLTPALRAFPVELVEKLHPDWRFVLVSKMYAQVLALFPFPYPQTI